MTTSWICNLELEYHDMVYSSQMWYLPVSLVNEGYREQSVRQLCLAIYPAPARVWRRPTCPDSLYLDTDRTPVHRVLFHTLDLCRRSKDLHIIVDPASQKKDKRLDILGSIVFCGRWIDRTSRRWLRPACAPGGKLPPWSSQPGAWTCAPSCGPENSTLFQATPNKCSEFWL